MPAGEPVILAPKTMRKVFTFCKNSPSLAGDQDCGNSHSGTSRCTSVSAVELAFLITGSPGESGHQVEKESCDGQGLCSQEDELQHTAAATFPETSGPCPKFYLPSSPAAQVSWPSSPLIRGLGGKMRRMNALITDM